MYTKTVRTNPYHVGRSVDGDFRQAYPAERQTHPQQTADVLPTFMSYEDILQFR